MNTTKTSGRARQPRLTDEERAQRRAADREYARQAVERLRSSDGWQSWLSTRAKFTRYSLTNQLMIAVAMPEATRVAGFKAWLNLGYCVCRGEKAVIRIWMPVPPSRKQVEAWQAAGADPSLKPRTFFRLGPVWDRSQVEPLPPPSVPAVLDPPIRDLEGEELADAVPALDRLAAELGVTVRYQELPGGAHGCYEIDNRRITLDPGLSVNAQVKTYCHELAHALARLDHDEGDPTLDYATEELVAESVAFTCLNSLGVSAEGYSIPYLTSWARDTDLEVLEHVAGLIDRLARRIESCLHQKADDAEEQELGGDVDHTELEALTQ